MRLVSKSAALAVAVATMCIVAGCDSGDSGPEYSRAYLTRFSLTSTSSTNNGQEWDPFGGNPDPVFILYDANNVELARSVVHQDVSPQEFPLNWTLSPRYEITDFNRSYYVVVWDADVDAADLIGVTNYFRMDDLAHDDYATSTGLALDTGLGQAEVNIRWEE